MLPDHFQSTIESLKKLQKQDRYLAMFLFGSAARDEVTEDSDLDVRVVVNENNDCTNVNNFFLNGIKMDITFHSFQQLNEQMNAQTKSNRVPMVAESIFLLDKTGELESLKQKYRLHKAPEVDAKDFHFRQFLIRHATNKIERNLDKDPLAAMLAMTIGINDMLKIHYELNQKWWVSNKRILRDLDKWDTIAAELLRTFLSTNGVNEKFTVWQNITNHILKQMGTESTTPNYFCDCETCKKDFAALNQLSI